MVHDEHLHASGTGPAGVVRRLAILRQDAGFTQWQAAARIWYSCSAVARAEATGVCSRGFCRLAGQLYGAGDELALEHDRIDALAAAARSQAARRARQDRHTGPPPRIAAHGENPRSPSWRWRQTARPAANRSLCWSGKAPSFFLWDHRDYPREGWRFRSRRCTGEAPANPRLADCSVDLVGHGRCSWQGDRCVHVPDHDQLSPRSATSTCFQRLRAGRPNLVRPQVNAGAACP